MGMGGAMGIAIGGGTDVAVESAGMVLAGNDPRAVLSMVDLSRASYLKMWQNLVWATGYNIIAFRWLLACWASPGSSCPPPQVPC